MPLSVLQSRFLEAWRMSGGVNAAYHPMMEERFPKHTISVVCKDGVGWAYDHVGLHHNQANGVKLEGEVFKALPYSEIEDRLELYNDLTATGRPVKVEEIGVTGLSRRTWTSRVYVATKPPEGASAAVVSVCQWHHNFDVMDLGFVLEIVERTCPPWIVSIFEAQDPSTMQTRAKILEMIANGDFGKVPAAEMVSLSRALAQLKIRVELEAAADRGSD